jgi:hypothetical protein
VPLTTGDFWVIFLEKRRESHGDDFITAEKKKARAREKMSR